MRYVTFAIARDAGELAQLLVVLSLNLEHVERRAPKRFLEERLVALGFGREAIRKSRNALIGLNIIQSSSSDAGGGGLTELGREYARELADRIRQGDDETRLLFELWLTVENAAAAATFLPEKTLAEFDERSQMIDRRWFVGAEPLAENVASVDFRTCVSPLVPAPELLVASETAALIGGELTHSHASSPNCSDVLSPVAEKRVWRLDTNHWEVVSKAPPSSAPLSRSAREGIEPGESSIPLSTNDGELREKLAGVARLILRGQSLEERASIVSKMRAVSSSPHPIQTTLLLHICEGERERLFTALDEMEGNYLSIFATCAPDINRRFLNEIRRRMRQKLRPGAPGDAITLVEISEWREMSEVNNVVVDQMLDGEGIDILVSAMPREAVFWLYLALNIREPGTTQRWFHNDATPVVDRRGKATVTTVIEGDRAQESTFVFLEPTNNRLRTLEAANAIDGQRVFVGFDARDRFEVNQLKAGLGQERWLAGTPLVADLLPLDGGSIENVIAALKETNPSTIVLSGSRVAALGMAAYYLDLVRNGEKTPRVVMTHLAQRKYSRGPVGPLREVLERRPTTLLNYAR